MSLIVLFAVVEQLSAYQLLDLIGHCAHGIISEVWAGLVDVGNVGRRALPAGHVHGGEIFAHIRQLDDVKGPVGKRRGGCLVVLPQGPIKLL